MINFIKGSIVFSMVTNPLTIGVSVFTTVFWHTPVVFLIFSCIYATAITWTVGGIALKKIKSAQHKDDLKTVGVFTLVGNNPLAGFLMLIMKEKQLEDYRMVDEQNRVYVPVRIDDK